MQIKVSRDATAGWPKLDSVGGQTKFCQYIFGTFH